MSDLGRLKTSGYLVQANPRREDVWFTRTRDVRLLVYGSATRGASSARTLDVKLLV